MERFEWNDSFNINVRDIDEQKQKIAAHINTIFEKREEGAEPKVIFDLLNELGEGLRMHFGHEEKIMHQLGYPELGDHRKNHKYYMRKTLNMRRIVADDPANLTDETLGFLSAWLKEHILLEDQYFAPYARVRMFIDNHKRSRRMR